MGSSSSKPSRKGGPKNISGNYRDQRHVRKPVLDARSQQARHYNRPPPPPPGKNFIAQAPAHFPRPTRHAPPPPPQVAHYSKKSLPPAPGKAPPGGPPPGAVTPHGRKNLPAKAVPPQYVRGEVRRKALPMYHTGFKTEFVPDREIRL